ncbi:MAG TPA: FAD-dependent oxidoreductase [Bacillota bacterium]|nr:FAD-dependent oxidoreductase [Bacillota bacterium]
MEYDVVIVGAGPAGMTAGVFAARKGLKALIVGKDLGGQVSWTTDIENYMGFAEIDGQTLMERFQAQVKEHNLDEKLVGIRTLQKTGEGFHLETDTGEQLTAKTVIICSGKKPRTLDVPGEVEFRNRGVSYCSTCDAPLFRDAEVAVVGGGNSAVKAVLDLANYAKAVHLIYRRNELTADAVLMQRLEKLDKLTLHPGHTVVEIAGNKAVERLKLEEVATKKQKDLPVQGIFIEIGLIPNTEFVDSAVTRNDANEIQIDCHCQTNIPGLYAAGDVSSVPEKQIIIAAGEGAKAAIKVWEYLMETPEFAVKH